MPERNLANLYFRRPRLLVLTLMLITVAGLASLQVLPRAEDPPLTSRWATIFTAYPGASAKQVESLVTKRIEDELREIDEIRKIDSSSRANVSTMVVELEERVMGSAADVIWSRVRDRLSDVEREFPDGVEKPVFEEIANSAWTILAGLRWTLPSEPNPVILGRLADELGDALRLLPGTEMVRIYGEPDEEITVEVDPAQLAAYGLSVADVSAAVRGNDSKIPAGQVRGRDNRLLIEVAGELDSLERIRNLPIHRGATGRILRLADIGTVQKGAKSPPDAIALISGEPGVVVGGRPLTNQRVDTWAALAREKIEAFREQLPRGVEVSVLFDQSLYTVSRLGKLFSNFVIASLLVTIVVFFVMGWRSAILVGSAVPLTTLMVLFGMNLFGVAINQMSVTGLIIALGLMIDNAIIMVDEVSRRLESGMRRRDAVADSVRHLFVPLAGSTATTIFAFMPIVLMPGPAGEFVGSIALCVILAIVSSLFLAMTVIPALAGLMDHTNRRPPGSRDSWLHHGVTHAGLARAYGRGLSWLLRHPLASLGVALLLPALGFAALTQLEEQFFPPAERDQFGVELRLPWQATIEQTRAEALAVRTELLAHPQIADVHWFVGESAPAFYYNFIESRRGVDFYAQALVQTKTSDDGLALIRDVQRRLDAKFRRSQVVAKELGQGPAVDAPIELRIFGHDIDRLRELGEAMRGRLAGIPGVTHTRATMEGGQPKLLVELDEEQARLAGFDNSAVATYLQDSIEGRRGGSMIEGTEDLPVRVRVRHRDRLDVASVRGLEMPGIGGWTPLDAMSSLRLVPNTATLPHKDGRRCNAVQAFVEAGLLPSKVLSELQRRMTAEGFELPYGFELEIGGEAMERDRAVKRLAAAAFVLLAMMAASLVLSFNSFRFAGIIAGVGFLSVGLSMLALYVFGYPLGFMAIVGTMGLVGVAVNDGIVVLAALKENEAAMSGDHEAVVQTVIQSTRHVVSTSLTTMAGFTPLIVAGGGFWPPIAVAVGGGVAGATVLAVTFVPTMFLLARRRAARLLGREDIDV